MAKNLTRDGSKSKRPLPFQVGGGEFTTDGDEATPAQFKRLMKKLNLARATPAEFLAVVLSVACPTPLAWDSEHRSEDDEYFDAPPILAEALTKLGAE